GAPGWLRSLREMGFDEAGIARLTRTFLDTVPGRMEALGKAVASGDCDGGNRTAHALKGSLAGFSAQAAMDVARRLVGLGRGGGAGGAGGGGRAVAGVDARGGAEGVEGRVKSGRWWGNRGWAGAKSQAACERTRRGRPLTRPISLGTLPLAL